jgi:hypothetical protein
LPAEPLRIATLYQYRLLNLADFNHTHGVMSWRLAGLQNRPHRQAADHNGNYQISHILGNECHGIDLVCWSSSSPTSLTLLL